MEWCQSSVKKLSHLRLLTNLEASCDLSLIGAAGLRWNGSVWKPDSINRVFTMSPVCREVAQTCDHRAWQPLCRPRPVAVEQLALISGSPRPAINGMRSPTCWECRRGVVDLRTGIEGPPRRDDYLTQATTCAIAPPGTPHPLWSHFLDRITNGNAELIAFLQRYIGYCATGDTSEHYLRLRPAALARTARAPSSTPSVKCSVTMQPSLTWAPSSQATVSTSPDRRCEAAQQSARDRAGDTGGPSLERNEVKGLDRRRQDISAVHAAGLLRVHAAIQVVHHRQPQTEPEQCGRGDPRRASVGAVLQSGYLELNATKQLPEAQTRVARDHALDR